MTRAFQRNREQDARLPFLQKVAYRTSIMIISGWPPRNKLLNALPASDLERLRGKMMLVELAPRRVLSHARTPLEHVYFIEDGLVSVLAQIDDRRAVEVWLVGREGVVGLPVILGGTASPNRRVAQISGTALVMRAADVRQAMQDVPSLSRVLLRYVQAVMVQTSQSGACNVAHLLQQRLARWLLAAQDRCERDVLPLTHDMLARMLGVRRASVSECIGGLEKAEIVATMRGKVQIRNRARLEGRACLCYRIMNAEYDRMQRDLLALQDAAPKRARTRCVSYA